MPRRSKLIGNSQEKEKRKEKKRMVSSEEAARILKRSRCAIRNYLKEIRNCMYLKKHPAG